MRGSNNYLRHLQQFVVGLLALVTLLWLLVPDLFQGIFTRSATPRASSLIAEQSMSQEPLGGPFVVPAPSKRVPSEELLAGRYSRWQETAEGRVELGQEFFRFARSASVELPLLREDVQQAIAARNQLIYPGNGVHRSEFAVSDPRWSQLSSWWRDFGNGGGYVMEGFNEAAGKFRDLASRPWRSEADEQLLWQLVVQCGREWLRIPYDEESGRFDFHKSLPADAPQTLLDNYQEMYRTLAEKEWTATPPENPSGFEITGGRLPGVEYNSQVPATHNSR